MPKIDKVFTLEITPERFVNSCDAQEFQELLLEVDRRLERENRVKQLTIQEVIDVNQNKKSNEI